MSIPAMILIRTFVFTIFTMCINVAQAQLCQGSLGDPIVHINFGSGSNPGPPLSAAATGYQYWSNDCPNDGQYTLRNNTQLCFSNSWHSLNSDHTGDPNGYFMLINASFQPSDFYVDTVDLFCSNTTYEFAAWVINVMRNTVCAGQPTILPNLTFSIEETNGTVIQTYNTGDIPVPSSVDWNQYGFFFTAPSGVNRIVLRITNNAPGGCGNDLAIDDITFRPCGPLVTAGISGNNGDTELCKGETANYTLTGSVSSGFDNPFYQWQISVDQGPWTDIPGANSTTLNQGFHAGSALGNYRYRLSVSKPENSSIVLCRVSSEILEVNVNPNPQVQVVSNSPVCENAILAIQASGGTDYNWTGPNSLVAGGPLLEIPNAQVHHGGTYQVSVTSDKGCTVTSSVQAVVNDRPDASVNHEELTICEGEIVSLQAAGGSIYQWRPSIALSANNISNPQASPEDSIRYEVIVNNNAGCADTAYVQLNVNQRPRASAGPDREMVQGQTINLLGNATGTDISFSWSPQIAIDDVQVLQPAVNPANDISYVLTVVSGAGCGTDTDTVNVKVYKGIFIPTAFTPNGDGKNDVWRIPGLGIYADHEVLVFNRYGELIFSTKTNESWNGTYKGLPQPTGAYPYLVKIREGNVLMKGLVMIVR